MRWYSPLTKPLKGPERWFAWHPVTLCGHDVAVWLEHVWRREIVIDSERYYIYALTEEDCDLGIQAMRLFDAWRIGNQLEGKVP